MAMFLRYFRLKLQIRHVENLEEVPTARSCLLHVSTRLNEGQRKPSQSDDKAVHLCLSFSQSSHEHETPGTRLPRVGRSCMIFFRI